MRRDKHYKDICFISSLYRTKRDVFREYIENEIIPYLQKYISRSVMFDDEKFIIESFELYNYGIAVNLVIIQTNDLIRSVYVDFEDVMIEGDNT